MSAGGIEVAVGDSAWREALADAAECCRAAAAAALAEAAADGRAPDAPGEVSIMLADDRAVGALNRRYRGRAGATNVLAFAAAAPRHGPRLLGDVVLARETVLGEARAAALPVAHHVSHLVAHGTLHLLGYDHEDDPSAAAMEAVEARALRRIGIADPYAREAGR